MYVLSLGLYGNAAHMHAIRYTQTDVQTHR